MDEWPVAKRRCAYSQRRHECAPLRTTHGKENATANNGAAAMTQTRHTTRCLLVALIALCCSSCGGMQNCVNPAGPQAINLSRLWWLMFIVCSVVFVLVMIALLLSLRNRTRESLSERTPVLEPSRAQA